MRTRSKLLLCDMFKSSLWSMFFVVSACAPNSATDNNDLRFPRISATPSVVDLGTLELQSPKRLLGSFDISNNGNRELLVTGIQSSCGCTVLDHTKALVEPGRHVSMRVSVKPRNQGGPQSSLVTIQSNDPATPEIDVRVQWIEVAPISFDPQSLDLGRLRAKESKSLKVNVLIRKSNQDSRLRIVAPNSSIVANFGSSPTVEADQTTVSRTLLVRVLPDEESSDTITSVVQIVSDEGYIASLPISWSTGNRVVVTPKEIFRSGIHSGQSVSFTLLIRSDEFDLGSGLSAELDGKPIALVTTMPEETEPGRVLAKLDFQAGDKTGIEKHQLRLHIACHSQESLLVPMTLLVD